MQKLIPVTGSSQVAAYAYDSAQRVLSVKFHRSPGVYHYQNVPPETAKAFEAADSKGKFIGSEIKGKFSFVKSGETEAQGA